MLESHTEVKFTVALSEIPEERRVAAQRRALQQVKAGETRPISELWNRIDAE